MKFKTINTIICSAAMSVVVVSAIFLAEIIRTANDLLLFPYLLVVAAIYAAMLLSENRKTLLLKWVLALPFSFLCFEYFWQTHYSVRALNWMTRSLQPKRRRLKRKRKRTANRRNCQFV